MKEMNILMKLPLQPGWKPGELECFLESLVNEYRRYDCELTIQEYKEDGVSGDGTSEDGAFGNVSSSDTDFSDILCVDLRDTRIYRDICSVKIAFITRLMDADADIPVEFHLFDVFVRRYIYITLPKHWLMLGDSYMNKHLEAYETAKAQRSAIIREYHERKISSADIKLLAKKLNVERAQCPVIHWACLHLILFVEKLSAENRITETMYTALDKFADGAYEEAVSLPVQTPDEKMLRYYMMLTHVGDSDVYQEVRHLLGEAANQEASWLSGETAGQEANSLSKQAAGQKTRWISEQTATQKAAASMEKRICSSGTALLEFLKWQMIREDYEAAVSAADQCLLHPDLQKSPEVFRLKGRALTERGNISEAKSSFEKAAAICRREAEKKPATFLPILAQCLCDKASVFIRSKHIRKAEDILWQAWAILQQENCADASLGFYLVKLRVLEGLCRIRIHKGQCNEALEDAEKFQHNLTEAHCYFPEPEKVYIDAEAYNLYGDVYRELEIDYHAKEKYSTAKNSLQGLRSFMPDAFPVLFADVCNNRGITLSENDSTLYEAKQEYLDAAELLESIPYGAPSAKELLGDCYYNLGLLYDDWGKDKRAEEYYLRARKIYKTVNNGNTKEKLQLISQNLAELH